MEDNLSVKKYFEMNGAPSESDIYAFAYKGLKITPELKEWVTILKNIDKPALGRYIAHLKGYEFFETEEEKQETRVAGELYEFVVNKIKEIQKN